jgi:glycerophosphoryl diester phosphodiesterase
VRLTRDDELIIFHDAEIAGTPVANLTRAEIEDRTGALPPSLEEVLALARGRIWLDVELKKGRYVAEAADLLSDCAESGGDLIVTSFVDRMLAQLAELAPRLTRGLVLGRSAKRAVERAEACGATFVLPKMQLVDEALLAELSDAGLSVIVWDFMAARHAALLSETRISGVITDDVPRALAARNVNA